MILSIINFVYLVILSFLPVSTLNHGLIGEPQSFYAENTITDSEKTVSQVLYRKLVNVNYKTGEIQKDLVDNYRIFNDGRSYEISLKKGQYWHDGVEITADDLLYTASVSSNLTEISSDKVDDYTVLFTLPADYSPFLSILNIPVLPAHRSGSVNNLYPVGSGNYRIVRIKRDRANIKEVVLVSNNKDVPFKKLVFKFYPNEESLRIAAKLYEIDSFLFNQSEDFEGFNSLKQVFYSRAYVGIFNTEKDYLTQQVRQNIVDSINFNQLIEQQEYSGGVRPTGPFSGSWAQSDSFNQIAGANPVNVGLNNSLNIVAPNIRQARLITENLKEQFEENGVVDVDIKYIEVENFSRDVREEDYDLLIMAQEYGIDPDRYVFWHSTQNKVGLNYSNLSNVRIDRALEEGRKALNFEERQEHYNIFQSAFSEEVPAFFIVHPTQYFYYDKKIESPKIESSYYPYEIFDFLYQWKLTPSKKIL